MGMGGPSARMVCGPVPYACASCDGDAGFRRGRARGDWVSPREESFWGSPDALTEEDALATDRPGNTPRSRAGAGRLPSLHPLGIHERNRPELSGRILAVG